MSVRDDWQNRVSWSDSVFDSLERFVDSKPDDNIRQFVESGDIKELYDGFSMPNPKPSAKHQEYMRAYAKETM